MIFHPATVAEFAYLGLCFTQRSGKYNLLSLFLPSFLHLLVIADQSNQIHPALP